MELWNETHQWAEIVFNALLLVLPVLAALAATSATGAVMIRTIKKVYSEWIRPAIDEPTDPLVILLAAKIGKDPAWVAKQLLENLDAVAAVLPEEAKPLPEGAPPL